MQVVLREERAGDLAIIRRITTEAFAGTAHGSGNEAALVDALRDTGALSLSLVVAEDGEVLGHVAFSPVTVGEAGSGWYGLGPVSVTPERQGQGLGRALIREGLDRLEAAGAAGCVVVGDPAFYGRFGFANNPNLRLDGVPQEYFMQLSFRDQAAAGTVTYHPAFDGV